MIIAVTIMALAATGAVAETWCEIEVKPENRCAPYDAKAYRYSASADRKIVEALGYSVDRAGMIDRAFPSPYVEGIAFRYLQDMDIEHIVARSEAHDSGLCASPDRWSEFASDPLNLTVASEHVNRTLKRDRDAAEWLPPLDPEWYAAQIVAVKQKYGLSIDAAERDALALVLPVGRGDLIQPDMQRYQC